MSVNPILAIDGYKVSHHEQYPAGTTKIYSNLTARSDQHFHMPYAEGQLIFFGLQGFLQWFLQDNFNENFFAAPEEDVVDRYQQFMDQYLRPGKTGVEHIRALHRLGYLPLHIKALSEGSKVPVQIPLLTITNTHPDFYWLVNYLETVLASELWKSSTNATIAYYYRKICTLWADQTCEDRTHIDFQCHDFSFRGLSGLHDAAHSGSGHLLSFQGTDNIPAIIYLQKHYAEAEDYIIARSIPATEHSVMCMGEESGELATFRRLISELYPEGMVSIVSDTWDYWRVLTDYTRLLKDEIMARPGRVVFRPDSGDPVMILCGTEHTGSSRSPQEKGSVEVLWEIFGGSVNAKGYKVLDPHVGLIYGDSISPDRADEILKRLAAKGFASSNVVFGLGSLTYQYNTRDTFGFAMKATYGEVNHQARIIYKAPKTDNGLKKSARGLLRVIQDKERIYRCLDQQSWAEEAQGLLITRFLNGTIVNQDSIKTIRTRVHEHMH